MTLQRNGSPDLRASVLFEENDPALQTTMDEDRFNKLFDGGDFIRKAIKQAHDFHRFKAKNPDASTSDFWRFYDMEAFKKKLGEEDKEKRSLLREDVKKVLVFVDRTEFGDFKLLHNFDCHRRLWFFRLLEEATNKPLTEWVRLSEFTDLWRTVNPISIELEDCYGQGWEALFK